MLGRQHFPYARPTALTVGEVSEFAVMRLRILLQITVVSILSFVAAPVAPTVAKTSPAPSPQTQVELRDGVAVIRPLEVRTRRLHRVRPDLIYFPIRYDTYC